MSNLSHYAQRSPVDYRDVYEGTDQNFTLKEISSCERNKTIFHPNERRKSKIWYFDPSIQKP